METSGSGRSRRPGGITAGSVPQTPTSSSSSVLHNQRTVNSKKNVQSQRHLEAGGSPDTFVPLSMRKITSVGSWLAGLVGFLKAPVMAFVRGSIQSAADDQVKKLKKSIDVLKGEIAGLEGEVVTARQTAQKYQTELDQTERDPATMTADDVKIYTLTLRAVADNEADIAEKNAKIADKKAKIARKAAEIKEQPGQVELTAKMTSDNLEPGLKILLGLRSVFEKKKSDKSGKKTYEISAGNMVYSEPGAPPLSIEDLKIYIDEFSESPGPVLTLNIPAIQGWIKGTGERMKLSVGGRVVISPPLSEPLKEILTCRKLRITDKLDALSKVFTQFSKQIAKPDSTALFSDAIKVEIRHFDQLEGKKEHSVLTHPVASAMATLLNPMLTGWQNAKNKSGLESARSLAGFDRNQCDRFQAKLDALRKMESGLQAMQPKLVDPEGKQVLKEQLERTQQQIRNAHGSHVFNQRHLSAREKSIQSLEGRSAPARQALNNYQNLLHMFFGLRARLLGHVEQKPVHITMPEQQVDITGAGHLRLYDLNMHLQDLVTNEDGSVDITIPQLESKVALHNSASKKEESVPVAFRDVKIHLHPTIAPLVLGALNTRFPIDIEKVERLIRSFTQQTSAYRDPGSGGLSPKAIGEHLDISIGHVFFKDGTSAVECDDRVRSDLNQLTEKMSDLLASPMSPQKLGTVLEKELGLRGEHAVKVLNVLSLGLLGPEPEPVHLSVPDPDPVIPRMALDEEGLTAGQRFDPQLSVTSEPLEVEHPERVEENVDVNPERTVPVSEKPDSLAAVVEDDTDLELSPAAIHSSVSSSPEPLVENLEDKTESVTPPPLTHIEHLDEVNESDEVSPTVEVLSDEPIVETPAPRTGESNRLEESGELLSIGSTGPVTFTPVRQDSLEDSIPQSSVVEAFQETPVLHQITLAELQHCEGITNPAVDDEASGEPVVSFDMETDVGKLFGKVNVFIRWLLGGEKASLAVSSETEGGVLELGKPRISVKKSGFLGWRSLLANYWLQRQLKKRPLTLELGIRAEQKTLSLQCVEAS
ncbi:hypothetical protein [Endozoicomonas numazuensis]|uniref:Uncharacterized protein n=1 Tax=Endozoicomonas numazuensis TaxID=1137799 RepID=A0A081NLV2_9GAMM|nr:hypothetical protein [Endozoicomonas numazuensis]KEQ19425.1 hypothetical protein GZ78_05605 [Endozoicomonas numazuensis]